MVPEALPLLSAMTSWTAPAGSAVPGLVMSKAEATETPATVVAPYSIAARMPRRSVRKNRSARARKAASLSTSVPPAAAPVAWVRHRDRAVERLVDEGRQRVGGDVLASPRSAAINRSVAGVLWDEVGGAEDDVGGQREDRTARGL
jgi:hypothetical protein